MSFNKAYKLAQKSAALQQEVLLDLEQLVKGIERGEKMVIELKAEVEAVNARHAERKTTREDIAYLEDLLRCTKKKLAWERHMEALSKRVPAVLARVSAVMSDEKNPPSEQVRNGAVQCLQIVHTAMERLEVAKVR